MYIYYIKILPDCNPTYLKEIIDKDMKTKQMTDLCLFVHTFAIRFLRSRINVII